MSPRFFLSQTISFKKDMLARCYSLKGQKNFERVAKEGKTSQSESFGISYLDRKDDDFSHFGFIVSTKISKEAVQRNRIKRAISEAVRFMLTDIKKGFDIIFLAKQKSVRKPTDELMNEVRQAVKKADFFKLGKK